MGYDCIQSIFHMFICQRERKLFEQIEKKKWTKLGRFSKASANYVFFFFNTFKIKTLSYERLISTYAYYVGTYKNKCLIKFQYGIGPRITLQKHPQKNGKGTGV